MSEKTAIVIGAGIAGLAMARSLSLKGYEVTVMERSPMAVGASIRNFGMVWPIGQPGGEWYETALESRAIWKQAGDSGAFQYDEAGSLHLAYHQDEWEVLKELYESFAAARPVKLLPVQEVAQYSGAVVTEGLLGALYSADELIVDPREAIAALPDYLSEKHGVRFLWDKCVSYVADATVYVGETEEYEADVIMICSGIDFETLFPETFATLPLTKCKLQMLRMAAQPDGWRMGSALCGGLSLIHYNSFKAAASLPALRERYELEMSEYLDLGIHVMAAQNGAGEITIGDSHEYGPVHDPFDSDHINRLILDYLHGFARFQNPAIASTWHGIYPKLTNGDSYVFINPQPGVYVFNGLGGAGMTLSFGLAERLCAGL